MIMQVLRRGWTGLSCCCVCVLCMCIMRVITAYGESDGLRGDDTGQPYP